MDVIVPEGSETELIKAAKALGHKEILILNTDLKKKPSHEGATLAAWIDEPSHAARASGYKYVFAPAERAFFESKTTTHLLESGLDPAKDQLYQRRTDIDEVMCELAREKGKTVVLDLRHADDPYILGRLMQTARVCKKHKVKTIICTFASHPLKLRSARDLEAFERLL